KRISGPYQDSRVPVKYFQNNRENWTTLVLFAPLILKNAMEHVAFFYNLTIYYFKLTTPSEMYI
ncbi:hypothetical protein CGH81_23650, partial [Vibrio parahaemolyticus]